MQRITSPADLSNYGEWMKSHPNGSLWQSLEWKTYQEALGREVRIYRDEEASALVVIDRTTGGLSTWDIPRGPLGIENGKLKMENFLLQIARGAQQDKCMSLFFSPQNETPIFNFPFSIFNSRRHEQPPATRLIDLRQTEEEILAQMKQKGRYNIRVAEKHGVRVERSTDIEAFATLAAETAQRDGFRAPPASRYKKFLESLPGAFLLLANAQPINQQTNKPVTTAGLLGVIWNGTGIYYYGASDYEFRNLMAPYLLQWEAMKYCKAQGCHTYDLLGISRPLSEQSSPSSGGGGGWGEEEDSWSGISRFKEQFGGKVIEYPPEQQIILKPWAFRMLQWKRRFL